MRNDPLAVQIEADVEDSEIPDHGGQVSGQLPCQEVMGADVGSVVVLAVCVLGQLPNHQLCLIGDAAVLVQEDLHRQSVLGIAPLYAVSQTVVLVCLIQIAVAQDLGILRIVVGIADTVGGVALNGRDLLDLVVTVIFQLRNQTHMLALAVCVPIEENQIAGFGGMGLSISVKIHIFPRQSLDPSSAAAMGGNILYSGIFHTEGGKHCTPITVGIAVPLTVTGIALCATVLGDKIVLFTFLIAHLTACNGYKILCPIT